MVFSWLLLVAPRIIIKVIYWSPVKEGFGGGDTPPLCNICVCMIRNRNKIEKPFYFRCRVISMSTCAIWLTSHIISLQSATVNLTAAKGRCVRKGVCKGEGILDAFLLGGGGTGGGGVVLNWTAGDDALDPQTAAAAAGTEGRRERGGERRRGGEDQR